ncbi:MAG: hypothetical protein EYC62_09195 [Alphaproteobacteria bacterium]|nr:MAG: hypothetical protein EYC62_09195 [Alphaproteobacteria bacterium]
MNRNHTISAGAADGYTDQWPSRRQTEAHLNRLLIERRLKPPALPEGKPYYYEDINPFPAAQIEKTLARVETLQGKIVYSSLPLCQKDKSPDSAIPAENRLKVRVGESDFDNFLVTFYHDRDAGENYMYLETVRAGKMGAGSLKKIFPDVMRLAQLLGCPTIRLSASLLGKYAWLRYGFLPYANQWGIVKKIVPAVAADVMGEYPAIHEVQAICAKDDPKAIYEIADLQEGNYTIETAEGVMNLPLGKALLMSSRTPGWSGELDLRNRRTCRLVREYCSGIKPSTAMKFFASRQRVRTER